MKHQGLVTGAIVGASLDADDIIVFTFVTQETRDSELLRLSKYAAVKGVR